MKLMREMLEKVVVNLLATSEAGHELAKYGFVVVSTTPETVRGITFRRDVGKGVTTVVSYPPPTRLEDPVVIKCVGVCGHRVFMRCFDSVTKMLNEMAYNSVVH